MMWFSIAVRIQFLCSTLESELNFDTAIPPTYSALIQTELAFAKPYIKRIMGLSKIYILARAYLIILVPW